MSISCLSHFGSTPRLTRQRKCRLLSVHKREVHRIQSSLAAPSIPLIAKKTLDREGFVHSLFQLSARNGLRVGKTFASFARDGGRAGWRQILCPRGGEALERPDLRVFSDSCAPTADMVGPCRSDRASHDRSRARAELRRRPGGGPPSFHLKSAGTGESTLLHQYPQTPHVEILAARDMLRCATRARIDATVVTGVAAKSWRV